jgi:glycosyltransferase involved in cell wall biosynthesis
MEKLPISVIIHTLNEQANLPHAIKSVSTFVDEIWVVDSNSTDNTEIIAKELGCKFVSRCCNRKGLVEQRNWALEILDFNNEWVFILDADEVVDDDLRLELKGLFVDNKLKHFVGFSCRYKNIFFGKWLRYSSMYPTWSVRLFKHELVRYEIREVNSHPVIPSDKHGYLSGHLLSIEHKPFESYLMRIVEFARLEASAYAGHRNKVPAKLISGRFWGSKIERRRYLKNIYMKLPGRPVIIFCYLYFFRLGFLDGRQGLNWALFKFFLEWSISMSQKDKNY